MEFVIDTRNDNNVIDRLEAVKRNNDMKFLGQFIDLENQNCSLKEIMKIRKFAVEFLGQMKNNLNPEIMQVGFMVIIDEKTKVFVKPVNAMKLINVIKFSIIKNCA